MKGIELMNKKYKGKKILIGDYVEISSEYTKRVLEKFGLEVEIVKSGNEILERVKQKEYDLIFTNHIYKEGPDGVKTLFALKNIENFKTPVIVHTISENQSDYFINNCGFDEYVVKPIEYDVIKPILDKFLK